MALVNYMGDAPGFLSYRRAPQKNLTGIPQRTAPAGQQKEFKQEEFDFDAKGNPGDRQFVYDQQKEFNQGLESLYNQYGGEMDWVVSDPKYKQIVNQSRWAIYDKDAAEQNEVTSKDREKALNDQNSGHSASDIEMVRQPDGSFLPRYGSLGQGGFASKEEVLQQVITEPQITQREDGTVGVQYVDFDNGVGSEKEFNAFADKIFTDGNIGVTRGAGTMSQTQNQQVTEGMDYAVNFFSKNGYDNSSNYKQIQDGVDYLLAYGMNDNQEYFLWNSFYKDVAKQKAFKMPKTDEEGNILKGKNGKAMMEDVYVKDEDLVDPSKRKVLFNMYVQDRILDYSQKFKQKSTESEHQVRRGTKNIDPNTGLPIEDQSMRRWESVVSGAGPAGEGFSKTETYPNSWTGGKLVGKEHDLRVYDNSNFTPGIAQANKALKGKSLGDIDNTGFVMIGKKWQEVNSTIKNMQLSDVQSVREVPAKNGKGTQWVARVLVVADNDETFGGAKYWNAETNKVEDMFSGTAYQDIEGYAQDQGFGGYMPKSDVKNKGYKINGDSEETSMFDVDDDEVAYMYIDVPVDNQMLSWDQFDVGESRESEGEQIEIGANISGVQKQQQMNQLKTKGKSKATF